MTRTILVTGATGTVGGATLRAVRDVGADPAAFVRDARRAAAVLPPGTPMRTGDLADEASLLAALEGVEVVLLSSGNDPAMVDQQLAAVRAIAASDVARVVKISGSPVSVTPSSPSRTGRDHLAVEQALRATGREVVAVRPNVFMQNFLAQADAVSHGVLPGLDGDPRVSFVDARDVGRVAAAELLTGAAPDAVVEVTGPEALSWFDVAATMAGVLGRRVSHFPMPPEAVRQALLAMGRPDWLAAHQVELGLLLAEPKAAEVTDVVQRRTGRAPTRLTDFLAEHAEAFPAAA